MLIEMNKLIAKSWAGNISNFIIFRFGFFYEFFPISINHATKYTDQLLRKVKKVLKKS